MFDPFQCYIWGANNSTETWYICAGILLFLVNIASKSLCLMKISHHFPKAKCPSGKSTSTRHIAAYTYIQHFLEAACLQISVLLYSLARYHFPSLWWVMESVLIHQCFHKVSPKSRNNTKKHTGMPMTTDWKTGQGKIREAKEKLRFVLTGLTNGCWNMTLSSTFHSALAMWFAFLKHIISSQNVQ